MCEEGFESKFGSEEGLNVFRTLELRKVIEILSEEFFLFLFHF